MTINERFEAIIKILFMGNKRAFAKAVGISPTVVENVVGTRKGKPSYDVLKKVCANANISAEWLLLGTDENKLSDMFNIRKNLKFSSTYEDGSGDEKQMTTTFSIPTDKDSTHEYHSTSQDVPQKKNIGLKVQKVEPGSGRGIPLIPLDAIAGFPVDPNESVYLENCERYVVPEFENKGANFLIRVSGDSMIPLYYSGDLLACRKITDIRFFQWGTIYVLETSQGILVKRVQESENHEDCILCVSENSSVHKPFLLPRDDIRSLSVIVGLIRAI